LKTSNRDAYTRENREEEEKKREGGKKELQRLISSISSIWHVITHK
jgi:hypothetical protein